MAILDTFRQAVETALAGRSAEAAATRAGLQRKAIVNVLQGSNPGLSRAGEIADALGFELYVRWKGETISPWALRLAIETVLRQAGKLRESALPTEDDLAEGAESVASVLIKCYGPFADAFDPSKCDDPEELFRISRVFNRHLGDVESKDIARFTAALESLAEPDDASGGDATAGTDDEPPAT